MDMIFTIGIGIGGLLIGGVVTWVIMNTALKNRSAKIIKEAETEGGVIKKEKMLSQRKRVLYLL